MIIFNFTKMFRLLDRRRGVTIDSDDCASLVIRKGRVEDRAIGGSRAEYGGEMGMEMEMERRCPLVTRPSRNHSAVSAHQ